MFACSFKLSCKARVSFAHTEQNRTKISVTDQEVSFYLQRKVVVVVVVVLECSGFSRANTLVVFRELSSKIPMGMKE